MSETAGAENVIPPTNGDEGGAVENQPADNPAWADFLGGFPESMHPMVKEHLSKWDEGINQRIQSVHSEYADFKPYRDAGITPDVLNQAYGIYQAVNDDPRKVWEALNEAYGFNAQGGSPSVNPQQGQVNPQPNQPTGDEYGIGEGGQLNPEVERLKAMTENMAQILIKQEEERRVAAEDAQLSQHLKAAHDKFGNFDETFVLSYVQMGKSMEDAVKAYQGIVNDIRSGDNRPAAPITIGGRGSAPLPSQQIDPASLNPVETRSLVANLMKAANQQGR